MLLDVSQEISGCQLDGKLQQRSRDWTVRECTTGVTTYAFSKKLNVSSQLSCTGVTIVSIAGKAEQ